MPKLTPNELKRNESAPETFAAPYGTPRRTMRMRSEFQLARREAEIDRQAVRNAQRRAKYTTE